MFLSVRPPPSGKRMEGRGLATFYSRNPEPSPYPLPDRERRRLLSVKLALSSSHSAIFQRCRRDDYFTTWYSRSEKFMHVHHDRFEVRTKGKGLYEITDDLQAKIDRCGVRNGTVTVF